MLRPNYLILLRSGDNFPTSSKTGLILFEDLLLGQGKENLWLSEKYRARARKSLQFILYRWLLAKFLNRRIFSDFLENQIGCRDLMIYFRDVQERERIKHDAMQETSMEIRIWHIIPKFLKIRGVSDKG